MCISIKIMMMIMIDDDDDKVILHSFKKPFIKTVSGVLA